MLISASSKIRGFIVNSFTRTSHNIRHYRVCHELLPGQSFGDWADADGAAKCGHVSLLQPLASRGYVCSCEGASSAARHGDLVMIRYLRAHGIHCTSFGADHAAMNGHLDVIHDLRAHGIHCTSRGADDAAYNGHLDVIRDL